MNLQTSSVVNVVSKRCHIPKGFYRARLNEVKPKKKESKFGNKLVLLFEILDERLRQMDGKLPILATETYYQYRNEDGSVKTALTPGSKATKLFENLGWKFSPAGLNTDKFVGAECEVLVEDYEYVFVGEDGKSENCIGSVIRDVNKWQSGVKIIDEEKVG